MTDAAMPVPAPLTGVEHAILASYGDVAYDAFWRAWATSSDEQSCTLAAVEAVAEAIEADIASGSDDARGRLQTLTREVVVVADLRSVVRFAVE